MAKSALNRHHTARIKNNRKDYWYGPKWLKDRPLDARQLGIVSKTPQPNACWCCSNPRSKFGRSFAELRLFQDLD